MSRKVVTVGKLHIAFMLTSLNGGGAERVMLNLARSLIERGHRADLVIPRFGGDYRSDIPRGMRVYRARLLRSPARSSRSRRDGADEPVRLDGPRGPWRPRNHDGRSHGTMLLHDALVRSYNIATVRLGFDVGLERVRETIRALGVSRPVTAFPAMLLGTAELAPIEVNAMYQSLATGGLRQPLRAIRGVTDRHGRPIGRYPERSTRVADTSLRTEARAQG